MSQLSVDAVDKQSGSTLTLGGAGTTVQPHASATVSGFGSPAYASNASATDDTVNVDASDNLQFNSGYGSTATAYGVRAWVNFDGTGTLSVKASGNVSSVTDNTTGDYTVNLTTAMPDIDYAISVNCRYDDTGWGGWGTVGWVNTASAFRIRTGTFPGSTIYDMQDVWAMVVR